MSECLKPALELLKLCGSVTQSSGRIKMKMPNYSKPSANAFGNDRSKIQPRKELWLTEEQHFYNWFQASALKIPKQTKPDDPPLPKSVEE